MKTRLKSKIVWMGVLAYIVAIVMLFSPQIAEYVKIIGASLIGIAWIIGLLNNPTDTKKF